MPGSCQNSNSRGADGKEPGQAAPNILDQHLVPATRALSPRGHGQELPTPREERDNWVSLLSPDPKSSTSSEINEITTVSCCQLMYLAQAGEAWAMVVKFQYLNHYGAWIWALLQLYVAKYWFYLFSPIKKPRKLQAQKTLKEHDLGCKVKHSKVK